MNIDTNKRIVVIGAGPGGIMMGIRLKERGYNNFVIYEKSPDLGGTWWRNRYPGNACDVPALNYSFSFAPNINAKRTYEGGEQLYEYFRDTANRFEVSDHIVYNTEIADAKWDGAQWNLTNTAGEESTADVVISAVGRLHRPKYPNIEGMDDFKGFMQHSTFWDASYDLSGKRVAVIGNGSSGVQIVSEASKTAGQLTLFQRTAQWVYPMDNEEVSEETRQRYKDDPEFVAETFKELEEWLDDIAGVIFDSEATGEMAIQRRADLDAALATVKDPVLREKLTPDHTPGCRRLIFSGEFYEAVQRPNVDVVTESIERIEANGIRTQDGELHEFDVIILATGFHADSFMRPMTVTGENGVTLDELWKDDFLNYKSVAIPHMPNLFTVNGPFSPGGSLSILMIIECHANLIAKLLDRVFAEDIALRPDADRSAELLQQIQENAKKTIWYTGGCQGWYLDKNGVPIVNPLSLSQLREDTKDPIWDDFVATPLPERVLV